MKLKESKNIDKNLDLARELCKMYNMRVTVITFVINLLVMIPKSLKIRGKIKSIYGIFKIDQNTQNQDRLLYF